MKKLIVQQPLSKQNLVEVTHPIFHDIGGDYIMPFGHFKGKKLKNIPKSYIDWLMSNILDLNVRHNIKLYYQQEKIIS